MSLQPISRQHCAAAPLTRVWAHFIDVHVRNPDGQMQWMHLGCVCAFVCVLGSVGVWFQAVTVLLQTLSFTMFCFNLPKIVFFFYSLWLAGAGTTEAGLQVTASGAWCSKRQLNSDRTVAETKSVLSQTNQRPAPQAAEPVIKGCVRRPQRGRQQNHTGFHFVRMRISLMDVEKEFQSVIPTELHGQTSADVIDETVPDGPRLK